MEASSSTLVSTLHCSGCDHTQSISEFISPGANNTIKQYRTCAHCRSRTTQLKRNKKKRQLEDDPEEDTIDENTLEEVIDLNNLEDFIIQIIDLYKLQSEGNLENMPPFHFECNIDISTLNKSTREVANELIVGIENVDEFKWIYHQSYLSQL
ncbi:17876_t:CDS:2 [Cetraspora pellucida]|uniref:17876_t:CDS:1 n=2 Tax=Gigasporaceae TaxID=36753 RepID=A0A9N9AJX5_9GLOM|nr:17876_t:CDS:2 [Cetraspora pellucida]